MPHGAPPAADPSTHAARADRLGSGQKYNSNVRIACRRGCTVEHPLQAGEQRPSRLTIKCAARCQRHGASTPPSGSSSSENLASYNRTGATPQQPVRQAAIPSVGARTRAQETRTPACPDSWPLRTRGLPTAGPSPKRLAQGAARAGGLTPARACRPALQQAAAGACLQGRPGGLFARRARATAQAGRPGSLLEPACSRSCACRPAGRPRRGPAGRPPRGPVRTSP